MQEMERVEKEWATGVVGKEEEVRDVFKAAKTSFRSMVTRFREQLGDVERDVTQMDIALG